MNDIEKFIKKHVSSKTKKKLSEYALQTLLAILSKYGKPRFKKLIEAIFKDDKEEPEKP